MLPAAKKNPVGVFVGQPESLNVAHLLHAKGMTVLIQDTVTYDKCIPKDLLLQNASFIEVGKKKKKKAHEVSETSVALR